MTEEQARLEATFLAAHALQDYADTGSVQDFYGDLPEDDKEKISQEFKKIIDQLEKRMREESW